MSNADFQARISRITQSHAPAPNGEPKRHPWGAPARNYRERLDRALAIAAAAGISRKDCFPPAMRALSAIGIPVRPLHFKSTASLFLSGLCLGLGIFGGVLWLFTSDILPVAPTGPIRGLISLGWPGVLVTSLCIGAAFTFVIRAKAARAGLPRWQDL